MLFCKKDVFSSTEKRSPKYIAKTWHFQDQFLVILHIGSSTEIYNPNTSPVLSSISSSYSARGLFLPFDLCVPVCTRFCFFSCSCSLVFILVPSVLFAPTPTVGAVVVLLSGGSRTGVPSCLGSWSGQCLPHMVRGGSSSVRAVPDRTTQSPFCSQTAGLEGRAPQTYRPWGVHSYPRSCCVAQGLRSHWRSTLCH